MKHFSVVLIFLAIAALSGCKKSDIESQQPYWVKLFPADSSYKTGGAFQLDDGSNIIYGFDPDNGGVLPVVIKTDEKGNVLKQIRLSAQFHFLTIKKTSDGNMLAVGIETVNSAVQNVCKIYPDLTLGTVWSYSIDSIRANKDFLCDFTEDADGNFIITASCMTTLGNKPHPYVLHINKDNGALLALNEYLTNSTMILYTGSVCRNDEGYAICGVAQKASIEFKGTFYLQLNHDLEVLWDSIVLDTTQGVTSAAVIENSTTHSTILCGALGGSVYSGTLFTLPVYDTIRMDQLTSYTDYDNLGRFVSINHTPSDNGFILAATVNKLDAVPFVAYTKIYLLKLDAFGNFMWSRQFDSEKPYTAASVIQTNDGGYLVSGYEHTDSYRFTMLMIKTDANGFLVGEF